MRMLPAWLLGIPALVLAAVLLRAHMQKQAPSLAAAQAATRCQIAAGDPAHAGMVWVPGGSFTMGSDVAFPEEAPRQSASVDGFWMDQTEVTNAGFAAFVTATGYRTLAEREGVDGVAGSTVFRPVANAGPAMTSVVNWWQFMAGADWRHPDGPQSTIEGFDWHPVVHVAYEDAQAYAQWKGHSLPTEAQFEYAARNSGRRNAAGGYAANTWQGSFPSHNAVVDGYAGTAPVGCFGANPQQLYDLIGNVWEWTSSPYYDRHDFAGRQAHPRGFDSTQPEEAAVAVLKGGSFLCAPDYCMRYRPEARIGQSLTMGAAHIGFRTVLNTAK
jgi:formylglycine-generating enzyme